MRYASFLEWQRKLERPTGLSDAETLFGLKGIASDEQIKNVLDQHSSKYLGAVFRYVLRELTAPGVLREQFKNNVPALVALDGARYQSPGKVNCAHCSKVENEGNNVLKTKGSNFEHNFGHGKRYLSTMLLSLLLLAFLFHTLFDLLEVRYQAIRTRLGNRRTFFGDLRTLTRFHLFTSWSHLHYFMAEGLELELVAELDSNSS